MQKFTFTVNGEERSVETDPERPLLWVLREELKLTGTKFGCGASLCGACTVHIDGKAQRSCATPIKSAAGKSVTTIEALEDHPMQVAWKEAAVPQCGYCQSGQIMAAAALLAEKKDPSDEDIDRVMAGNICRCGTYGRIRAAIKSAAQASQK